jgi:hypothetical protein
MDLASGYSDSINYGNGYTPLATGAINNNNADYARNQAAIALMAQNAQNNVFASGGGFGQQTADYAGAGAAYGRATGGFNGGAQQAPSVFETGADPYQDWLRGGGYTAGGGGIGSDAARAPNQPDVGASFNDRFSAATQNQPYGPGYFDNTFGSVANTGGTSFSPYQGVQPMTQQQPVQQGGGFGASGFGPYGGSTYTGQPGFGLGIGTMGTPTQQPDISAQWDLWRMSGMQGPGPNAYQNAGMSMQDRADTPYLTENQFRNVPNDLQAQDRAVGQQYNTATKTSPAIDPQPYYGGHPVQFPVQPQYNPDPSPNFGNNAFPLITYEHDAPNLLDPNMLNRQQQQNMGSG